MIVVDRYKDILYHMYYNYLLYWPLYIYDYYMMMYMKYNDTILYVSVHYIYIMNDVYVDV